MAGQVKKAKDRILEVMLRHAGRTEQYMVGQDRTKKSRSGHRTSKSKWSWSIIRTICAKLGYCDLFKKQNRIFVDDWPNRF
jgi:hypothetical protein